MNVEDIRIYLKKPVEVWNREIDNVRVMVSNYGSPNPYQKHKLRLIIRLEKSTRNDSSGCKIWNKLVSWVDCTYSGNGDISNTDNWFFNSAPDDLRFMLMEVGVRGLLSKYNG